ncbi:phage T7 exclusion protein [Pectobacterium carotovorum subsp. carotovorum]|nr:phage T7 exclusion protein [Pectobacterium carotovorum subsp. carotovorum]
MNMNTAINSAAISSEDDDRYGFAAVAKSLAQSITALDKNVSTVIGIEGKWGTGKTSMLNLLLKQIQACTKDGTHVLHIAPWLNAPEQSPIGSLLLPVAAIVAEEDERRQPRNRKWFHCSKRKKQSEQALNILNYLQQTSGRLASIADFAGNFIPGLGIVAQGMETLSELDLSAQRKTTATLRTEIEENINKLGLNFIVIIDDLDRLEPAQAVEVIRLVKSVADFSRFHYVLCYDRQVLSHAVEQGLGVIDGNQYLQKIVQISFSLPRPETFDLRREFKSGAVALYESVNTTRPDEEMLTDLARLIDTYGTSLTTPREVCTVLNALKFCYAGLRDYVYFPDLCFLQIIRTTNIGLYDWVEDYLTKLSLIVSGEGFIRSEEIDMMDKQLKEHLINFPMLSIRQYSFICEWVAGIDLDDKRKDFIFFQKTSEHNYYAMRRNKRLGSDTHWRYYFSFSAPQNILPQSFMDELLVIASEPESYQKLSQKLLDGINSNGLASRTWFEHILSRFTPSLIASLTYEQCAGFVSFFVNDSEDVIERYKSRNSWFLEHTLDIEHVVDGLLMHMMNVRRDADLISIKNLFVTGKSLYWIVHYLDHLLCLNDSVEVNITKRHISVFSSEELSEICIALAVRLNSDEVKNNLLGCNKLLEYLQVWQKITSPDTVSIWVNDVSSTDKGFIKLLLQLQCRGIRERGLYFKLDIDSVSQFLVDKESIINRLKGIELGGLYPQKIKEIREAISNN